ncbi:PepSY-associated TM helix domain-containing protein [Methylobacterium komagatae]
MPSPRAILFRLHWALGLTAGLVLAVMGATGALLSYQEALTDWANGDRLVVSARETPPLALSALTKRIEEQNRGLRVARLTIKDEPTASVAVRFDRDANTKVRPDSVYADPYDGTVLGPMRGEALFNTVLGLHRFLLIPGDSKGWGRQITGVCAIALIIFLASGLVLRWPQIHRLRIWLRPNLSRPGRARWWSLHAVAGTWLLPVYLIIAVSGLTWSYDGFKDIVNAALGAAKPAKPMRTMKRPEASPEAKPDLDAVWTAFREGEGRGANRMQILLPETTRQPVRIRWFLRDDDRPAARNEARYEAATGTLISTERAADQSLGQRAAFNMLEVHRGRFFGEGVAILFCLASVAMPGFAATGIALYVLRRRAAARRGMRKGLTPVAAE